MLSRSVVLVFCTLATACILPGAPRAGVSCDQQQATYQNLLAIGDYCQIYVVDNPHYPIATSIDELERVLVPEIGEEIAKKDAWGNLLVYTSTEKSFELRSLGADGKPDNHRPKGASNNPDDDIIFCGDDYGNRKGFAQWPKCAVKEGSHPHPFN
jgi:hypothetical protein